MAVTINKIMVVDDSQAILMVMQAILTELGIADITCCNNAKQALQNVQQAPFQYDAIFTDLNMPDMDGMELIRQLGELKFSGGVAIISEMDNKVIDLAANLARQCNAHLIGNITKPVQLSEVDRLIHKLESFIAPASHVNKPLTESELLNAISHNQITPFYQPKVNRVNKRVPSIEVLARIVNDDQSDILLPHRFIGPAEDLDLINLITFQLFEKATEELKSIRTELRQQVRLAFNLSPTQLNDPSCPDKLALILELNRLTPQDIILEITEHLPLDNNTQLETMNRLRIRGFEISLDDFGTGFTNLHQLKSLPFTEIKIDRSLITHVESDRFSQVIIDSLVDIAQNEQLSIVAEGVERIEELQYLDRYKHNLLMQGFLICKPKPKQELIRWIHSWLRMTNSNS
ncbi:EAL domain-containing protein [Pseudoalteromonas sp. MMG012]|uniref:EAL domain-containing response regulator n=1 Tax=Pseudoalteromonas sp. MMG012 TaxID=2822686 RepID=UPI001B3A3F64|nr:EAL domain-containing response regulator [Pseudoalteromonas sp. MMG012]MBQ4852310.1 EAL domain-containing response regulator [Pseudoalteromonas sp. MMG012]